MKLYSEIYPEGIDSRFTLKVGNTRVTKTLGILLTNHCNAECSFCCKSSSPRDKRGLEMEENIELINQAKRNGFEQIGFSGGEVMLNFNRLLTLAVECKKLNLSFTIATNGFWAKNKESGRLKLRELKKYGLTLIQASYDESHSEFISKNDFQNLLEIAIDENVFLEIHSSYFDGGKRLKDFFSTELLNKFKIHESPSVKSGRAKELPDKMFVFNSNIPSSKCPLPFQLTVDFDKNIYPCCSVSGFSENIKVGNIDDTSIEKALNNIKDNFYLYFIQRHGFKAILEKLIIEKGIKTPRFLTVCDVCSYVSNNKVILNSFLNEADIIMTNEILEKIDSIENKNCT
jgi:MoaA/NifB/PqqE/SkfB family radical SAM enzyme